MWFSLCLLLFLSWPLDLRAEEAATPVAQADVEAPEGTEEQEEGTEGEQEDRTPQYETVVTATRIESAIMEIPASVTTVDRERMRQAGTKSIATALSDVSGVVSHHRQEDATFTGMEIRGLSTNSTSGGNLLFILDGVPQRRLSFGGPYIGALPYFAIERMELVKGPLSSLFGRNALAGALQLFSDAGSTTPAFDALTYYEYPSHTTRTALRYGGPIVQGRPYTLSLTGSYGYANGWQPRAESQRGDFYLNVAIPIGTDDQLNVFGGFFHTAEEAVAPVFLDTHGDLLPGFERDTNLSVPDQNALTLSEVRIGLRWRRYWNDWLRSSATIAYWHGDTFWNVGRPSDQPSEGTVVARSASDRRFVEHVLFSEVVLRARFRLGSRFRGHAIAGVSYEFLRYDMNVVQITTGDALESTEGYRLGLPLDLSDPVEPPRSSWVSSDPSDRETWEHNTAAFARLQTTMSDRLHVHAGFRYDFYHRTQHDPASLEEDTLSGGAWSPSVGVNVSLLRHLRHQVNIYAQWGLGFSPIFRAVNNTQFAEVEPERSEGFEGGLKWRLFDRMFEGELIFYQLERQDIVAMNPETLLQENTGDWRIGGLETTIGLRPMRSLLLTMSYSYRVPTIVRFPTDPTLVGNRIPAISKHTLSFGVEVSLPYELSLGAELRYVSEAYGNEQNSFRLPGYVLLDARLGWRFRDTLRISVFGRNLLDQMYYTAVFNRVRQGSAFAGAPLTIGVTLDVQFD